MYDAIARKLDSRDWALLFVRLGLAITILFHGWHKLTHGVGHLQEDLILLGFPGFVAYLAYVGEIVAPIMLLLGTYSRAAALFILGTCVFIFMVRWGNGTFLVSPKTGGLIIAEAYLYLSSALAIFFAGSGRFALRPD